MYPRQGLRGPVLSLGSSFADRCVRRQVFAHGEFHEVHYPEDAPVAHHWKNPDVILRHQALNLEYIGVGMDVYRRSSFENVRIGQHHVGALFPEEFR